MNTYEQKCLQLDKELAEALGWTDVSFLKSINEIKGVYNGVFNVHKRWTQDDGECFRLAVEYEIDVYIDATEAETHIGGTGGISVQFSDFPDKLSAVRFAICSAVLAKLKGN